MEEKKHCKWYNDEFCTNDKSPCVADFCPVVEYPELCKCRELDKDINVRSKDDTEIDVGMLEEALVDTLKEVAIKFSKDSYICRALADTINFIHRLQSENERLKDEKEEIKLFNLAIQNGEVDMSIESEMAKSFYNSIVQIFEQNGAKNFFTTTIDIDGKKGRYAFTIEKVGGKTVAETIAEQKAEIERLTEEIDQRREMMSRMDCNYATELRKNAELQKQVDELQKRLIDEFEAFKVEAYGKVKQQAEKDTAKKCNDFIHALICKYNGYIDRKDGAYGNMHKEADEFTKEKFGVEVE